MKEATTNKTNLALRRYFGAGRYFKEWSSQVISLLDRIEEEGLSRDDLQTLLGHLRAQLQSNYDLAVNASALLKQEYP